MKQQTQKPPESGSIKPIQIRIPEWKKQEWKQAADEHFQFRNNADNGNLNQLIRFCVDTGIEIGPDTLDSIKLGIKEIGEDRETVRDLEQEVKSWKRRYKNLKDVQASFTHQSGGSPAGNSNPLNMASLGWAVREALSGQPQKFDEILESVKSQLNLEQYTLYVPHDGKTGEDAVMQPEEVVEAFLLDMVNRHRKVEVTRKNGQGAYRTRH